MYSILFLAIASFVLCLGLTPLVRILSQRSGMLDRPTGGRKLHANPVPNTGGFAIAAAYLIAVGLLLISPLSGASSVHLPTVLHLLPAAGVVFVTGLIDDVIGLSALEKLFGQLMGAGLAYWGGVHVSSFGLFRGPEWATLPITIGWLVLCTNAFNLIDGIDGLATGVGLFATFTMLAAALLEKNTPLALAMAPLFGALLAFLRYNFNPASIFLGDCGSLTVGFMLGCVGALWSQKSATVLGMTAPLLALSVPLLDTMLSVARRFLRHQPIFGADRNHIHHRLLDRGFSPRGAALVLYGFCGIAAALSLLQTMTSNRFDGLLLVIFSGAAWVGVQFLGYVEFDAARRMVFTGSFRRVVSAHIYMTGFEKQLAAATTEADYWNVIREANREFGFAQTRMELRGHTYEIRSDIRDLSRCCSITIPLGEGYVSFTYPFDTSLRHAAAMTSLVETLQRTLIPQPDSASVPVAQSSLQVAAAVRSASVAN